MDNPFANLLMPGPNTGMQGVPGAPLPYDLQLLQAQRQQKLAEMLQQQSAQPIEVQQGGGAPAPISWGSVLAKALQGVGGSMRENRATSEMQQAGQQDTEAAKALAAQLQAQPTNQVGTPAIGPTNTQVSAALPQLPGQPAPAPAAPQPQAQLAVGGAPGGQMQTAMTPPDQNAQIAAILAARGGPQTQMIQSAMLPQILNRQNMDYQHQLGREDKQWENAQPMSTAAMQEIAARTKAQEDAAKFTNQLPQTAQDRAQIGLGYAQLNKPQFVPYGSTGYMQGGTFKPLTSAQTGGASGAPNPNSPSAPVNLGISSNAYNLLTGNTSGVGTRDKMAANHELDAFFARSGLDPSLVKPQVQAFQNNVNINTMKANAMDTLAKEVVGTVQNYGPVIDQLTGNGSLRIGNKGFELIGSALNDPTAQKALYYLNQMRADMAGFNAVSGGKIGLHGQVGTDNADFAKADEVIKGGLSSGGARALAEAIEATRQKNVAIAQGQTEEAQRGIWNALGIGPRFDATHPRNTAAAPPPAGGGKTVVRTGTDKNGKKVVQYSDGSIAFAP